MFAAFFAVAPVVTATAAPATATTSRSFAPLPVTRFMHPPYPVVLETLLRNRSGKKDSSGPIRERFPSSALARADECVADLGGAIAVLEGRSVGCNVCVARDRGQHVMQFVDERVSPADDVSGRPPVLDERMVGLRDEHAPEAAGSVAVGTEDLQLVEALHVEGERPLGGVDLPLACVAPAERQPRRLDGADGAVLELDRRLDGVVDLAAGDERAHEASDG